MFKSIAIVALSLLASLANAQQWEQVGWKQPGLMPAIREQVDSFLYGGYNDAYYTSTDWGTNWTIIREGLPHVRRIYGNRILAKNSMAVLCLPDGRNYMSTLPNGFYYHKHGMSQWEVKQFSPIDREDWYIYDLRSLHYFSDDSIAILYCESPQHSYKATYGVYVSTNGGATWEQRIKGIDSSLGESFFRRLEKQGDRLIAYTSDYDYPKHRYKNILYKSDNFGESWEKLILPLPDSVFAEGQLNSINDSLMIFNTEGSFGYYFSPDRGDTWYPSPVPLPKNPGTVYPIPQRGNDVLLVIENNKKREIYSSATNGRSWERHDVSDSNLSMNMVYGNRDLYLFQGMYRIEKGTYVLTSSLRDIQPLTPKTGAISGDAGPVLYYKNRQFFSLDISEFSNLKDLSVWSDEGIFLNQITHSHGNHFLPTLWSEDNNIFYAHGYSDIDTLTRIYRSSDFGLTWSTFKIFPPLPSRTWDIDTIIAKGDFAVVLSVQQDTIFYTINGGINWRSLQPPAGSREIEWVAYEDSILYLLDDRSDIYYSNYIGFIWNTIPKFSNSLGGTIGGIGTIGSRIVISTSKSNINNIYYSDDRGQNWTKAQLPRHDRRFEIYNATDGILYAIANNIDNCVIISSNDSGATWLTLGDSTTAFPPFYIGESYYYLADGLWRLPKQPLAVKNEHPSALPSLVITPNPIAGRTSLTYSLPSRGAYDLAIYDLLGRKHATLASGIADGSEHTVQWNAEHLTPGVYVVRLVTAEGSATRIVQITR